MVDLSNSNEDEQHCVLAERDGPVCIVTINRPEANNAISLAVRDQMVRVMEAVEADDEIRVVIMTGEGEDAFSVGADVGQLATMTPPEAIATAQKQRAMTESVVNLSKPVIAAIKGACTGAGMELALHCDIRFARADARFGLPGINIGITPGGGAVSRLSRLIGAGPARALCLTGGIVSAERAFMLGLVTNVLSPEDFDAAVEQLAQHMASLSPVALRELKQLLNRSLDETVDSVTVAGAEALERCFSEGDAGERLRLLFGGPLPDQTVH